MLATLVLRHAAFPTPQASPRASRHYLQLLRHRRRRLHLRHRWVYPWKAEGRQPKTSRSISCVHLQTDSQRDGPRRTCPVTELNYVFDPGFGRVQPFGMPIPTAEEPRRGLRKMRDVSNLRTSHTRSRLCRSPKEIPTVHANIGPNESRRPPDSRAGIWSMFGASRALWRGSFGLSWLYQRCLRCSLDSEQWFQKVGCRLCSSHVSNG
ncbi:hypothetical protein CGCSCA5_v014935 [Colletotrichum siamense]|nr:hypothetical protein CGCSCA5_v014935 [Colletotrichum siamense]KAF4878720.1 hypothetical protein CGCSCA1_v002299 [Colletotrichum siamense]